MVRSAARIAQSGSRALARAAGRAYSRTAGAEVETGFDVAWGGMREEERARLAHDYAAYEAQDWHALTLEQKRACTVPPRCA